MDILKIDERIRNSIDLGESQFREFKSCWEGSPQSKQPRDPKMVAKDISETLVAFANADGGELLIGVENDGTITGIQYSEETITKLLDSYIEGVHPDTPLAGVINRTIHIEQNKILYFAVEKSVVTIHHTSDGRCLQRRDRENVPVSSGRLQFERSEQQSREYDRQFVDGAEVTDLDIESIKQVSQHITKGMSIEKTLQALGLAEYGIGSFRIRESALLLFAKQVSRWHPRCQVRVLKVRGSQIKSGRDYNVISDETVTENIVTLVDKAWEKLRPHLVETKMTKEGVFREISMYPEEACREALINAIAHRNYALEGQNIEIRIFEDRMEIVSPGGLLSTLKIEDLVRLKGLHESRNAFIARVLRTIGYVRELGEGMRRIFLLMQDADLVPPELISEHDTFTVVLRYKSVFSQEDQRWLDGFQTLRLTKEERLVALLGKDGATLSPQQIYDRLRLVDWDVYRAIIEQVQTKGITYNSLSELQKKAVAKRARLSQRQVPRIIIRQPLECEKALADLFAALYQAKPVDFLTSQYLNKVLQALPTENIYRTNSARLCRLLGLIGFIDEARRPTSLMKIVWGKQTSMLQDIVPKQIQKAFVPTSRFSTPFGQKVLSARENKIYVAGVDYDTLPDELRKLFSVHGTVVDVSIPRSYVTNQARGFAFVTMANHDEAEAAINALNGTHFRGRTLRLDWHHTQQGQISESVGLVKD